MSNLVWFHPGLALMLFTGSRVGEFLSFCGSDINTKFSKVPSGNLSIIEGSGLLGCDAVSLGISQHLNRS
jgi:hypothetical protein